MMNISSNTLFHLVLTRILFLNRVGLLLKRMTFFPVMSNKLTGTVSM